MIRLRRHSAFVLLAALLIGGLPVLHSAQHAAEYAEQTPAAVSHVAAHSASQSEAPALGKHVASPDRAQCDLCAHMLHGTPAVTQPTAFLHEAVSEKTRLRSRVVAATPYHFVIRGPPVHA